MFCSLVGSPTWPLRYISSAEQAHMRERRLGSAGRHPGKPSLLCPGGHTPTRHHKRWQTRAQRASSWRWTLGAASFVRAGKLGGSHFRPQDDRTKELDDAKRPLSDPYPTIGIEGVTGFEGQVNTAELVDGSIQATGLHPNMSIVAATTNWTSLAMGGACGEPLSSTCFDFSRCEHAPTMYVYDDEVIWAWCLLAVLLACIA